MFISELSSMSEVSEEKELISEKVCDSGRQVSLGDVLVTFFHCCDKTSWPSQPIKAGI